MNIKLVVVALVLAALGGGALYLILSRVQEADEAVVKKDAHQLATAFVKNDASLAPDGSEDWVPGVWAIFKRVDSASVVRVGHRKATGPKFGQSGSDFVADLMLHTGRGLVLLELSFRTDSSPRHAQEVDLLYELRPERIPAGLLDDATLGRLKSDRFERGGKIADDLTISIAGRTAGSRR
jgi:hypothetical protein